MAHLPSSPSWSEELERCVDEALGAAELTDDLVDRCLEVAGQCDVADPEQVYEAFAGLWNLASRLWPERGAEAGHVPVVLALDIALDALAETGDPAPVLGLGRQLRRDGLPTFTLAMYDQAVAGEAPPRPDIRPAPIAQLQSSRGDLLRELGHLDDAEAALTACLDAIDPEDPSDQQLLPAALNNLALVQLRQHHSARARDTLVDALRAGEAAGDGPRATAVTLDNLA